MAGGAPTSFTCEIEFSTGSWTAVSAYLRLSAGVTITQGRSTASDDGQPGTLTLTLENFDGRFTPDNPTSPYYPNVVEGKRIRVGGTGGGVTSQRFLGYIRTWMPDFTAGSSRNGLVQVTAADRLGQQARVDRYSDYASEWLRVAKLSPGTGDVWPFADGTNAGQPQNIGTGNPQPGQVILAATGKGEYSLTSADPLLLDGAISLAPDNEHVGPVLLLPLQANPISNGIWFRTDDTAIPNPGLTVASWRTAAGTELASVRYVDTGSAKELQWWVNAAFHSVLDVSANDGRWRFIWHWWNSTATQVHYDYSRTVAVSSGIDIRDTAYIVVGGAMNPLLRGNQARCIRADYAGAAAAAAYGSAWERWALPDSTASLASRFGFARAWGGLLSTDVAITGTDNRNVAVTSSVGRSSLDVLQEIARTIGGQLWVRPSDGDIELLTGDSLRPQTVAFTVTAEADDDVTTPLQFVRGAIENPTRVTASTPQGDVTYIDTAAELIDRRDGSVQTASASLAEGESLAAWLTLHGKKLRIKQLAVDPVTAVGAAGPTGASATHVASGTLNYLVATDADAADVPVTSVVRYYNSLGQLKEPTVFTVSATNSAAGFTNITVTPPMATVPAAGDQFRVQYTLWNRLLNTLKPGARVQVDSLDSTVMGFRWHDAHVLGWSETWLPNSVQFLFDTEPADQPAEFTLDDDDYGILDFDEGGCVLAAPGLTASATTCNVTIAAGNPITLAAGDYPMRAHIGAEEILINSAPSGSTGARTLTITRGAGPVPGYAHAAGEELRLGPASLGLAL